MIRRTGTDPILCVSTVSHVQAASSEAAAAAGKCDSLPQLSALDFGIIWFG
jgi:hypothetical protein